MVPGQGSLLRERSKSPGLAKRSKKGSGIRKLGMWKKKGAGAVKLLGKFLVEGGVKEKGGPGSKKGQSKKKKGKGRIERGVWGGPENDLVNLLKIGDLSGYIAETSGRNRKTWNKKKARHETSGYEGRIKI